MSLATLDLNLPRSGLVQQAPRVDRPPLALSFVNYAYCLPLRGSVRYSEEPDKYRHASTVPKLTEVAISAFNA